ncbi:hypothetical protein NKH77_40125 [Streptomyces sp. M19]
MTRYADIPKPIRSGIVIVDPERGTPNASSSSSSTPTPSNAPRPQSAGDQADGGAAVAEGRGPERGVAAQGPAQESWKFTAEIDATDQFEIPAPDGIHPQLAVLEMLVQPTTAQLRAASRLSQKGAIEISPIEMPLTLFTWGASASCPSG